MLRDIRDAANRTSRKAKVKLFRFRKSLWNQRLLWHETFAISKWEQFPWQETAASWPKKCCISCDCLILWHDTCPNMNHSQNLQRFSRTFLVCVCVCVKLWMFLALWYVHSGCCVTLEVFSMYSPSSNWSYPDWVFY